MSADEPKPCAGCPWIASNAGKRHPDGWYTKANLARLWAKLRQGEGMSCHRTDPGNPVSDRAQAAGYRPVPDRAAVRECAGALILQQREFMRLQDDCGVDLRLYRRRHPRGLTRQGAMALVERAVFGGTPVGGRKLPKPDLNDVAVQYEPLGEWAPR